MPVSLVQLLLRQLENGTSLAEISRRQVKLAVARQFWALSTQDKNNLNQLALSSPDAPDPASTLADPFDLDPADDPSDLVSQRGIVVRTDFSNDSAWNELCDSISRSEKDGLEELRDSSGQLENASAAQGEEASEDEGEEEDQQDVEMGNAQGTSSATNDADETDDDPSLLEAFILFSPPPSHHHLFKDASNIALLRLLTDLSIIPQSPPPSGDAQRSVSKPPPGLRYPITGIDSFIEVYQGPSIWVYDLLSNADGSLRCVALRPQEGQYGVTTGDSWRAKGRSVWDLQLNIDAGTITIDFIPDANERSRNLPEAA